MTSRTEKPFLRWPSVRTLFMWFYSFGAILFSEEIFANSVLSFTLDGHLSKSDGSGPLLETNLQIKLQILNPAEGCILYEETQKPINTEVTQGYFNIQVGSPVSDLKRTSGDSGRSMMQVYSNLSPIQGKSLANGSPCLYSPVPGDSRYLRITLILGDGTQQVLSPNMALNSVPRSIIAESSETLQGLGPNQFLNLGTTPQLTQANVATIFSDTHYPRLTDLLSVDPAIYIRRSSNGAIGVAAVDDDNALLPLSPGQLWYNSSDKELRFYNGIAIQSLAAAGSGISSLYTGTGLTGGPITTGGQSIAVDVGTTAGKIVQVETGGKLPALDGSQLTNIAGSNIAGNAGGDLTSTYTNLKVAKIQGNAVASTTATAGQVFLFNGSQYTPTTITGDIAVDQNGSATIKDGVVANTDLINSSITVSAGTGLTGGGTVSLGNSVTLTNAGVTSISGTANRITASASTGSVTLDLPQDIHTGATPTFAQVKLAPAITAGDACPTVGALAVDSSGDLYVCKNP